MEMYKYLFYQLFKKYAEVQSCKNTDPIMKAKEQIK
jgi:hypothetical protein